MTNKSLVKLSELAAYKPLWSFKNTPFPDLVSGANETLAAKILSKYFISNYSTDFKQLSKNCP